MIKKKDNVINFPEKISKNERKVEGAATLGGKPSLGPISSIV